jgi:hypothetical protein
MPSRAAPRARRRRTGSVNLHDLLEAYETKRWPLRKEPAGRGNSARPVVAKVGLLFPNAFVIAHVALGVVLVWRVARWLALG